MADTKLKDLVALPTPSDDDILYVVADPAGSPLDRKATVSAIRDAPGRLIEVVSYNPGVAGTPGSTSSTPTDVDATNLAVTFTVPPSGQVLIRLNARASVTSNTENSWCLREASSVVPGTTQVVAYNASAATGHRGVATMLVSGLTPGAVVTYKWGHARTFGTGTCQTIYGGANGPAVMEVWSA